MQSQWCCTCTEYCTQEGTLDTCEISRKSCSFKWSPWESKCPTYSMYCYMYNTPNETEQITLYLFTMLTILHHLCHLPKGFLKYFLIPTNSIELRMEYTKWSLDVFFFVSLVWYALCHFILYAFCILPLYIRNAYTIQLLQLKIKLR